MINKVPTPLTGTVTQIRRMGLVSSPFINGSSDEIFEHPRRRQLCRYVITYVAEGRPHDLELVDDGVGGFEAKVTKAVRHDMESRRYIECRDEGLTLPLAVSL